jgi:hypothetical protein
MIIIFLIRLGIIILIKIDIGTSQSIKHKKS